LDGKLIPASIKSITLIMAIIVKLSTLPKLRLRKALMQEKIPNNLLKSSNTIAISLNHGKKPKNTKNIQAPLISQIVNYQTILTGETLVVSITPTLIEIKVTVALATQFLSPKLLK